MPECRRSATLVALALTSLAALSAPDLGAQEAHGSLAGTVTDQDGRPLPAVVVHLEELDRSATTNEEGRYAFADVPAGTYTLRFRLMGRSTGAETARVTAGREARLDVVLTRHAIALPAIDVMLERVRLVGRDASEVPGAAHVLDSQELDVAQEPFDDVHALLRRVPGVNVQEEEGYGLRPNIGMRGTGSERSSKITIMEDGVLIAPAPYAAPSAYYFPVAGRMEAIEVRKGSSQIKYGPRTTGGALNLVSAPIPDELTVRAEVQGSEDATRKVEARVGDAYRNFGWMAQTYQLRTDGFKRLDGGGGTGFDVQDYLVKARVNTDPDAGVHQSVELKLGYTDEVSDETYLGLTDADFRADPLRRYAASREDQMNAEHWQAQLRHFLQPSQAVDVTTTLYNNDFARNWYKLDSVLGSSVSNVLSRPEEHAAELEVLRGADSEADALYLRANNREYYARGVESILGLRFGDRISNELEVGVRYHRDQEDRFQHEDGYRMVGGRLVRTSQGAPGSQSNRVSDASAWAFFAQDRIRLGEWTLTPGLRFERIRFERTDFATDDPERRAPTDVRENGVDVWIPGLGVSREVGPALTLFGGVHKGFGPPGPGADADARSEESWNYELGSRVTAGALRLQAVGFYSDYSNILGRATLATGESGAGDLFNGGEVDVKGLELSADLDLLAAREGSLAVPVRLAYTYTDARFRSDFESDFGPWGTVRSGDELPYLSEHQLFVGAGVAAPAGRLDVTATAADAMRTVAGSGTLAEGEGTDAYLVLGVSGEFALSGWSRLYAGVRNLTDDTYVVARRPAGARPGLPRTFVAGLRLAR